jgi:hypothetical protein
MRIDETVLYEQFVDARRKAVELTDRYRQTPADDPRRAAIWEGVIQQTELARGLLDAWLNADPAVPGSMAAEVLPPASDHSASPAQG